MFQDLLVVELCSVLAGPLVGQFFAELGARVIKCENTRTTGDVTRSWKLSSEPADADLSAYFLSANFGKQSIGLDLQSPEDLALCERIIQKADVLIHNFKPGDEHKLGLSYEHCRTLNPRLIYAHITGYGASKARVGYDAIIQAESGFMSMNGEPGTQPTKLPVALMDVLAAHQLKEAVLLALLRREKEGVGAYVHVSLIGSALSSLANQASNYLNAGTVATQQGSDHPNIVPYGRTFVTLDGARVILAVGSDRQFQDLCQVLGLKSDDRFATNHLRVQHRNEVNELLEREIGTWNHAALIEALSKRGVPVGKVRNIGEVLSESAADPYVMSDDGCRSLRSVVFEMNDSQPLSLPRAPHYDEHGDAIRHEFHVGS